jgi:hypothetical protein
MSQCQTLVRRSIAAVVLCGTAACGPSKGALIPPCDGGPEPQSSGGITGAVTCTPINAVDSTSWNLATENSAYIGGNVLIIDSMGACPDVMMNSYPANTTYVNLTVYQTDATGAYMTPTAGDYTIHQGEPPPSFKLGSATFASEDGLCTVINTENATAGTITVSSINLASGGGIVGTFDLTFGSDHLSGSFNAPYCAGSISSANLTCR